MSRQMQQSYEQLIQLASSNQQRDSLTAGQMLLLAFDSLFNNVDSVMMELRDLELSQEVPEAFLGVDVVREAARIVKRSLDDELFDLLRLSTFVARLTLLRDFFTLCRRTMLSFKADPSALGQMLPTGDELARPVKVFLAEFYWRHLVGFATRSLSIFVCHYMQEAEPSLFTCDDDEEVVTKAAALEEVARDFIQARLRRPGKDRSHFLTLELGNLVGQMQKLELTKCFDENIEMLEASQQINHVQRNSFQWFHESDLPMDAITLVPPLRPAFMDDLRQCECIMRMVLEEVTTSLQGKYQQLHSTVEQRMKWACGANPDLQEVFDAYSTAVADQMETLKTVSGIHRATSSIAGSVLHHEALRTQTREAVANDSTFMALMGECHQSASLKETSSSAETLLGEDELTLFTMSPPTDMIDQAWIRKTEQVISGRVKEIQKELEHAKSGQTAAVKELQECSNGLRVTVTAHQKLMNDVGGLLRTISKSEDYEIPEVHRYLALYKDFQEAIKSAVRDTMSEEQNEESVKALIANTERAKEMIAPIYEDIIHFSGLLKEENVVNFRVKKQQQQQQQLTEDDNSQTTAAGASASRHCKTEEKNAFALNVLRRVRLKLEGREPDALQQASVADQVRESIFPPYLILQGIHFAFSSRWIT